ncbi:tRNA (guanine-N(7)-)-methyltransferase [Chloropicon primus]|nr:tRNA (guanine-N(7)-)-methyltransferase [Chloropicon primus]
MNQNNNNNNNNTKTKTAAGGGGAGDKKRAPGGRAEDEDKNTAAAAAALELEREEKRKKMQPPKKRLYRTRAHSNPLNDQSFKVPRHPSEVNWAEHFPAVAKNPEAKLEVENVDVGCGFGGYLLKLGEVYPDQLSLGLELRDKVTEYVADRITALRAEEGGEGGEGKEGCTYENVAVLRANAQKDLPHYFRKGQLRRMFFLFPDPHFKASNHRRRIISEQLLDEYAHFIRSGGRLYTITDVEELGAWMKSHLDAHPLFERVGDEELDGGGDEAAKFLPSASEEAQKVKRNEGKTYRSVYRRR